MPSGLSRQHFLFGEPTRSNEPEPSFFWPIVTECYVISGSLGDLALGTGWGHSSQRISGLGRPSYLSTHLLVATLYKKGQAFTHFAGGAAEAQEVKDLPESRQG